MLTSLITQKFGKENTAPEWLPTYAKWGLIGHNGVDFLISNCSLGRKNLPQNKCEPVYYDTDVEADVCDIVENKTAGKGIKYITEDKDGIFKHIKWHFFDVLDSIKVGDKLETGQLLGWGGTTGHSTGPHEHRGLKPMGRDQYGNLYKLHPNNGYDGAVDILPYFEDIFVLDKMKQLEKMVEALTKQVGLLQKIINLIRKITWF